MDSTVSTSASTLRPLPPNPEPCTSGCSGSQPSSPRSSALPSPPDSPESVSSFSSSFFFSSAAASPPHSHLPSDHARESTQGLIIPSLMLPSALRRPTAYGQTLGEMRLLVLGGKGAGKTFLSGFLVEDNEDVVEVGAWEETDHGMVLRASTDWVEHKDAHGLEKFEPARNVEILELPGYDQTDNVDIVPSLLSIIQTPFDAVQQVLRPKHQPSAILTNLISSPNTPLYTALIFLLSAPPTPLEQHLLDHLSPSIPVIVLPRFPGNTRHPARSTLSSFRPTSTSALRAGLFRSPDVLSTLRCEAAERFLRWREIEHAVEGIALSRRDDAALRGAEEGTVAWTKAEWETQWEASLSHDVARRLREGTLTAHDKPWYSTTPTTYTGIGSFDPLHLPSLVVFSLSLLGPIQSRAGKSISGFVDKLVSDCHVRWALLGGFCVGIGLGWLLR